MNDLPSPPPLPTIVLVAAMSRDRVIGKKGTLPWHLPAELAHFEGTIRGQVLLSGRKSYESPQGAGIAQLGRQLLVLTSQPDYQTEFGLVVSDPEIALQETLRLGADTLYVLGGESVYRWFIGRADRIILTTIHTEVPDGDRYFPEFEETNFVRYRQWEHPADEVHPFGFTVNYYQRKTVGND